MAQTWRSGTFASGLFAESVWSGLDNGVAVSESAFSSSRFPDSFGWYWFW